MGELLTSIPTPTTTETSAIVVAASAASTPTRNVRSRAILLSELLNEMIEFHDMMDIIPLIINYSSNQRLLLLVADKMDIPPEELSMVSLSLDDGIAGVIGHVPRAWSNMGAPVLITHHHHEHNATSSSSSSTTSIKVYARSRPNTYDDAKLLTFDLGTGISTCEASTVLNDSFRSESCVINGHWCLLGGHKRSPRLILSNYHGNAITYHAANRQWNISSWQEKENQSKLRQLSHDMKAVDNSSCDKMGDNSNGRSSHHSHDTSDISVVIPSTLPIESKNSSNQSGASVCSTITSTGLWIRSCSYDAPALLHCYNMNTQQHSIISMLPTIVNSNNGDDPRLYRRPDSMVALHHPKASLHNESAILLINWDISEGLSPFRLLVLHQQKDNLTSSLSSTAMGATLIDLPQYSLPLASASTLQISKALIIDEGQTLVIGGQSTLIGTAVQPRLWHASIRYTPSGSSSTSSWHDKGSFTFELGEWNDSSQKYQRFAMLGSY
jgi:hypothetical protein